MNTTAPKDFKPPTPDDLTPELIKEAFYISKRYDRNLAAKDGAEVFPVPNRTARLLALAVLRLHKEAGYKDPTRDDEAAQEAKYAPGDKAALDKARGVERGYFAGDKAQEPQAQDSAAPPSKTHIRVKNKRVAKKTQKAECGPPLTPEQSRAFEVIKGILAEKQVVTTRLVAERGQWGSHNTGARHIKNLIDLGYLKRVGRQQVLALTGLAP